MARELDARLAGSRIDRIIQTTAETLVLKLWTGREKLQLVLQADARGAYFLSDHAYPAPAAPPRFCQLLRARLRRLLAIRCDPFDRIVHFACSGPEQEHYALTLELLGAQVNLLLVGADGKIVDLLHRRDGERTLLPGRPYRPPERRQRYSLVADPDGLAQALARADAPLGLVREQVAPMTPALHRAIAHARRAGRAWTDIITELTRELTRPDPPAQRVCWGEETAAYPMAFELSAFERVELCGSLSDLVAEQRAAVTSQTARDLEGRLRQVIRRQRQKLQRRLRNIETDRERHADPGADRLRGELLIANLYRLQPGAAEVTVDDYYQDPPQPVTIRLDSRLTPQENAERYFQRARKAERGADHHRRRSAETRAELAWLDQVALALDEAEDGDDLYQVQAELAGAGLLRDTVGQLGKRRAENPADRLRRTATPGGYTVYIGRNNRTNDYLSREMTAARDYWLHAHRMPGSHVVLKTDNRPDRVPEADLLHAAALAAGYSRGRHDAKVEVMIAEGRAVKRPKGAPPGLVTVDPYRTVLVAPQRLDD